MRTGRCDRRAKSRFWQRGRIGQDFFLASSRVRIARFTVPAGLIRILDRDLRAAGIPKVDERGRTVDVHAPRHTFGTLLSKAGYTPGLPKPQ